MSLLGSVPVASLCALAFSALAVTKDDLYDLSPIC